MDDRRQGSSDLVFRRRFCSGGSLQLHQQRHQRRPDEFRRSARERERHLDHHRTDAVHLLQRHRVLRRRRRSQDRRTGGRQRQRAGYHLLPLLYLQFLDRLHRRPGVRLPAGFLRPPDRRAGHQPVVAEQQRRGPVRGQLLPVRLFPPGHRRDRSRRRQFRRQQPRPGHLHLLLHRQQQHPRA